MLATPPQNPTLQTPPIDVQYEAPSNESHGLTGPDDLTNHPRTQLGLPKRVGNYLLIREIAAGGMGTVYEAVQDQPRRIVALKLLRPGRRSREQQRRFEFESELLARLRHPGIAQVYEAGTHEHGDQVVPYFVMELIPGAMSITRFAESKKLSVGQRLALFAQVCDAVQHAHAKAIVHRDLKPGNILIDALGAPKVIDFGVARAADSDQFSPTLQTDASQLIGTLQYMSPEQCQIDPRELDARSDVYALGVVLYELLNGRLPYELNTNNLPAATRIIREQAPIRPSTINSALKGDIETVLLKSLHKDRARRYQTAADLAADVRHVLAGQPIEARRDSAVYVLKRRGQAAIGLHRVSALLVVFAASVFAAHLLVGVVDRFFNLSARYERIVMQHSGVVDGSMLRTVRVIALRDEDDLAALAKRFGIDGLSAENNTPLRALHGKLMERLAQAGPGVVAFDIGFQKESRFDEQFVQGAKALRRQNIDVVVGGGWWPKDESDAHISPALLPYVRFGSPTAEPANGGPVMMHAVVQKDNAPTTRGAPPRPAVTLSSLALTTVTSFRHPGAVPMLTAGLDHGTAVVDVHYAPRPGQDEWLRERIQLTEVRQAPSDDYGWRARDVIGRYYVNIPAQSVLEASTIDYVQVFALADSNPAELRQRLASKAILIGDQRHKSDGTPRDSEFMLADGRKLAGFYANAVAIDSLLSADVVSRPGFTGAWGIVTRWDFLFALAAAGAAAGIAIAQPHRSWRLLLITAIAFLTIASAILAYRFTHVLYNPLAAVAAAFLAGEAVATVRRVRPLYI